MSKKISLIFSLLGLVILLIYSHNIRCISYDSVPEPFSVLDERTNVAHGISLRRSGVPAAWSDLRSYWDFSLNKKPQKSYGLDLNGFNIYLDGKKPTLFPLSEFPPVTIYTKELNLGLGPMHTSIMQPYLDHPPLGGLILSSLVPDSAKSFEKLSPFDFRKTSVYLALISTVLIFLLAAQISKSWIPGLISAGVYASVPTFLLTSRMAFLENALIPFELLVLNLLIYSERLIKRPRFYNGLLLITGILAGLATLTKTVGFALVILVIIVLFLRKSHLKQYLFFIIPALVVSSLYILWGLMLSPQLFMQLLNEQSTRRVFVGSLNFLTSFVKFGMPSFPLDGWWVGGFITLIFMPFVKETRIFLIGFAIMLFLILFTGASSFPWYVLPLVPYLAISTGYFLWNIAIQPKTLNIILLFLIFFSSSYYWGIGAKFGAPNFTNYELQFSLYKIFLTAFFAASLFIPHLLEKNKKVRILWFVGILVLIIFLFRLNFASALFIMHNWGDLPKFYQANWQF